MTWQDRGLTVKSGTLLLCLSLALKAITSRLLGQIIQRKMSSFSKGETGYTCVHMYTQKHLFIFIIHKSISAIMA